MKQLVNLFRTARRKNAAAAPRRNTSGRRLTSESLEKRELLAGDILAGDFLAGHNYAIAEDVNRDYKVTPLDALLVINQISRNGGSQNLAGVARGDLDKYFDVSGDNSITPLDALRVINRLGRGEAVGELVEFRITPRTANDESFSAADFNLATRNLTVDVNEVFSLEVSYNDLRNRFGGDVGVFTIYSDILTSLPDTLEPVLTETQSINFNGMLRSVTSGDLQFSLAGAPATSTTISYSNFFSNPTFALSTALTDLGFQTSQFRVSEISIADPADTNNNPLDDVIERRYQIRFTDLSLANQDLADLVVTPVNLVAGSTPVNIAITNESIEPRTPVLDSNGAVIGSVINQSAIPLNIDFRSRTFGNNQQFFGISDDAIGSFDATTGFSSVGATGRLVDGVPAAGQGPLIEPFDAFSVPVRVIKAVSNLQVTLGPTGDFSTRTLLYGSDDPVPDEMILINLDNDPAVNTDGFGLINITAVSGTVTVAAADSALAVTEDTAATINLAPLTTVSGSATAPVFTVTTQPARGSVSITGTTATFTPASNDFTVSGSSLTFVYTATVDGVSDTGTITVDISNVNDAPEFVADTAVAASQGVALTIAGSTLLSNDRPGPANGAGVAEPGTVSIATTPAPTATSGTVALVDGNLVYTSAPDFTGAATITYTITDGSLTAEATLVVNVSAVSIVTVTAADSALAATEDTAASLDLLALTTVTGSTTAPVFTITTQPARGSVSISGNSATYTPAANDFTVAGSELTFVYTATVGGVSDTGTVTVSISNVNDAPEFVADTAVSATQGIALTIVGSTLLSNDRPGPANGAGVAEPGSVSIATTPGPTVDNGSVVLVGGDLVYTSAANFTGTATISYTITDGALTAPATLSVSVAASGVVTVAAADSALAATEDTNATLNLATLTTVTGSTASPVFTVTTQPARGNVVINGSTATFTPAANDFTVNGSTLTFVYTATVGTVSDTGTVTVSISNVNDAPEFVADAAQSTTQGVALTIPVATLLSNDRPGPANGAGVAEPGTVSLATSPAPLASSGTVAIVGGNLVYTPTATFTGAATITYTITDGELTAPATLTVNVNPQSVITVVAGDSSLSFVEDGAAQTIDLSTLTSVTGSTTAPTFTIVTQPARGTLTLVGSTATYTPAADDFTTTPLSFVYRATVGSVSDTGTVSISISAVDDAPVVTDDTFVVAPGSGTTTFTASSITANDRPGPANETGTLTLTAVAPITGANATRGTVALVNGNVVYTPPANFQGVDRFNYTVSDGSRTSTGVVTVAVAAPSTVSGVIFTDYLQGPGSSGRNGVRDGNEPLMAGVTVVLTSSASSNLSGQQVNVSLRTDGDGEYAFTDLLPGTYTVTAEYPSYVIPGPETSFQIVIPSSGGVNVSGNSFTTLGFTSEAEDTLDFLVSRYLRSNAGNPSAGSAMIILDDSDETEVFQLGVGYENVSFLEFTISDDGDAALVTILFVDGSVQSKLLGANEFAVSNNDRVIRLLGSAETIGTRVADSPSLAADFDGYRDAIDAILAAGDF